jgi:SulP family sulfate permease
MFFGSMLIFISVGLLLEWLVAARGKMMEAEYAVCVATFLAIMFTGIEIGMAIGVLLSMVSFVIVYARLTSLSSTTLLLRSSTVVRSYEERAALLSRANRGKIVTINLKGYVFFGSAIKILEEVKKKVVLASRDASPLGFPETTVYSPLATRDYNTEFEGD